MSKKWFPYRTPRPDSDPPKVRLLCFHHAGGTAQMYNKFIESKDFEVCAVQLPGREHRDTEPKLNKVQVRETVCAVTAMSNSRGSHDRTWSRNCTPRFDSCFRDLCHM